MKITNEQVAALLAQQELMKARPAANGTGFENLLSQELQNMGSTETLAKMPPPGAGSEIVGQILIGENSQESENSDPFETVMRQAFTEASGTLDLWDRYTQTLSNSSSEASLREAYNLLQGIDSKVAVLKESSQAIRGRNPGLDGLMNELEVMAFTEKFKFNRGDYN